MPDSSRRGFLASSLALLAGGPALAASKETAKPKETPKTAPSTAPVAVAVAVADPGKAADDPAFQPSTLFLTWQRDPTTTMTVQWIAAVGETGDTKVYYSSVSSGSSSSSSSGSASGSTSATRPSTLPATSLWLAQSPIIRPYPTTDLKVFRAELTGLKPDTNYQFRIGKSSPTYRFRTMPAKATNAIHFISGGDCGVNAHAIANNIQAARQDPMFALIGGDLAYENGKTADIHLAFLRNYSRNMIGREGRLIPMVACIGNHEVDGGYNKPASKAPFFYSLFDGIFHDTSYNTLDFGDYLSLVLLDSGHTSPIEGEQASWLEKTLKARVDHPNVIAVNHVPAYPSYRKMSSTPATQPGVPAKAGTGSGNREHWTPLFDKYRVPVVLEHHDHTFKRTKPLVDGMANDNGVLYLGDGSWGRIRAPQAPEKLGFLATASRDYHLSLHRIQGDERFHLALDEFGVMDVGHSGQRKRGIVSVG